MDTNFSEIISTAIDKVKQYIPILNNTKENANQGNDNTKENENEGTDNNNENANEETNNANKNNEENINEIIPSEVTENTLGVSTVETEENNVEPTATIEPTPLSQMEMDAEYVKNNYNLEVPVHGTITSPYGERNIVPKFHVGVDIGANTGTNIISATDGTVTLASTVGDYGNHIKITNNELTTLYAHCSTLCVKEGQEIKKGEKIAEVGETGNATGPHLHFEIILERTLHRSTNDIKL